MGLWGVAIAPSRCGADQVGSVETGGLFTPFMRSQSLSLHTLLEPEVLLEILSGGEGLHSQ